MPHSCRLITNSGTETLKKSEDWSDKCSTPTNSNGPNNWKGGTGRYCAQGNARLSHSFQAELLLKVQTRDVNKMVKNFSMLPEFNVCVHCTQTPSFSVSAKIVPVYKRLSRSVKCFSQSCQQSDHDTSFWCHGKATSIECQQAQSLSARSLLSPNFFFHPRLEPVSSLTFSRPITAEHKEY